MLRPPNLPVDNLGSLTTEKKRISQPFEAADGQLS